VAPLVAVLHGGGPLELLVRPVRSLLLGLLALLLLLLPQLLPELLRGRPLLPDLARGAAHRARAGQRLAGRTGRSRGRWLARIAARGGGRGRRLAWLASRRDHGAAARGWWRTSRRRLAGSAPVGGSGWRLARQPGAEHVGPSARGASRRGLPERRARR